MIDGPWLPVRSMNSLRIPLLVAVALAAASCATPPSATPAATAPATGPDAIEGTVASIDLKPWTYDGNAVVEVDTADRGRVAVQLPARWNLCQAAPVDVEALAVGIRVQAAGERADGGALVVCTDASHRLAPVAQD